VTLNPQVYEDRGGAGSLHFAGGCLAPHLFADATAGLDGLLEDTLVNRKEIDEPLIRRAALTDRETQILQSILAGMTNKQIARALSRSQRTVEYHRNRLMQKLRARSAAELVRLAIIAGIT